MTSRGNFVLCAICAAGGVLAAQVGVSAQAPGFTRTVLNRIEYPGDTMVTVQVLVEIDPNAVVPRHTHPGVESGYIVEGGGTFGMKGQPDHTVSVGDAFQVPYQVPHFLKNGPKKTRVLSVYVVEKDKPLASPAPE
jgi:quercetin dioxygenase-like cupin family protein